MPMVFCRPPVMLTAWRRWSFRQRPEPIGENLPARPEELSFRHHGSWAPREDNVYTFIKPNEDILAWHDGNGKKNGDQFHGELPSQSRWVLFRQLPRAVDGVHEVPSNLSAAARCCGLSQGGAATLLNAVQTQPTAAIIASGYSVIYDLASWSGHNQIIGVKEYGAWSQPQTSVPLWQTRPPSSSSRGGGAISAATRSRRRNAARPLIEPLENVEVVIHDQGHIFPVAEIKAFLDRHLPDPQ